MHFFLFRKEATLKRERTKGVVAVVRDDISEVKGVLSDDIREEMLKYIRTTSSLNRDLYEITNPSKSNDNKEDNTKEERRPEQKNGRHKEEKINKIMNKEIKRFTNSYERFEDNLKVKDITQEMWERGENMSEVISVEISSKFIGRKAKYIFIGSKVGFLTANAVMTLGCRAVLSSCIILKSGIKRLI